MSALLEVDRVTLRYKTAQSLVTATHRVSFQVNEGDRLSVAIARAGNSQNSQGDLNHIHLIRKNPDGSEVTTEINLYSALNGGDRTRDVALEKPALLKKPSQRRDRKCPPKSRTSFIGHPGAT